MADFKLRAPPRLRFYGAMSVDGVIGTGGTVALAGSAVARAQSTAALLKGINIGGSATASAQAAAALFKAANLSSVAIAGASATGDLGGPDADWNARSAGSVFANRLQTQGDLDAWVSPDAPPDHCSLDTAIKVPGAVASFKVAVLNTDGANSGAFRIFFGSLAEFGDGETVWFSFRVRAPAQLTYQPWPGVASTDGNKLAILSRWTGSNQVNEVVFQSMRSVGMVAGYYQNGTGYAGIEQNFTSAAGADYRWQTDVDLGANSLTGTNPDTGAAWTAYEQQRRQYGMLYLASSADNWRVGYGDPLAKIFRHYPDEWITITSRVVIGNFGSANNRWTAWAARQGQPYQKLWDRQNIQLGAGPNYDALWLLPYMTNRTSGGKKVESRSNTFTGAEILIVGLGTPTGAGTLEYNATTQRFRWAGNGEAFGTARGFSTANDILTLNVTSGTATNSYLVVKVTPALLPPTGVVTDTITIAEGRPDTQINYNDVIISTAAINAPGGYAPLDSTSTLARIAAAMPARSWVYLDGSTQNGVVCAIPANIGPIMGRNDATVIAPPTVYANKANWNPVNKCIEIVGRYHGLDVVGRYARYIESTHSFDCRYYTPNFAITHNFDQSTLNPSTGELYQRNQYQRNIARWASGGDMETASNNTTIAAPLVNNTNWGPNGVDWWSGTGAITGGGAQGVLICIAINDDTQYGLGRLCHLLRYNPVSNSWLTELVIPNYGDEDGTAARYNSQLVYSRTANVAGIFGGHQSPLKWWRVNADATISGPFVCPIEVKHTSSHIHADPATGNFIVHSRFGFYELNPTNNVWTNINGVNGYPARPSNVNYNTSSNGFPGITVTSLYEHGVLCYISGDSSGVARMHLYKHG